MLHNPTVHEAQRAASLTAYNIIDTAPEEDYDAITSLAARLCDAPMCVVSFLHNDRVWAKSAHGLGGTRVFDRNTSHCTVCITQGTIGDCFLVNDCRKDPRFDPCKAAAYQFYAGVPIGDKKAGVAVGALCVLDTAPRPQGITDTQRAALVALAQYIQCLLNLRTELYKSNESRESAIKESLAKSSFVATMSHEIRTPLNAIVGMTDLLLNTSLTPTQHEFASVLQCSSQSLLVIVNNLLDFSKISAKMMKLEDNPFNLRQALTDVVRMLFPNRCDLVRCSAAADRVTVHWRIDDDVPTYVRGDVTRFRQVVLNLLKNSVKFSTLFLRRTSPATFASSCR